MCLFYGVSPVSLRRLVTEVRAVWQHHAEKLTGRVCHTLWLRALGEEVSAFQCGGQVWDGGTRPSQGIIVVVPAPGRQEDRFQAPS
jgi:hypothetical protein